MSRHGQIQIYGGLAPLGEHDIINNEDYKLKVIKSWNEPGQVYKIEFRSSSIYEHRFEIFLTKEELQELRRVI